MTVKIHDIEGKETAIVLDITGTEQIGAYSDAFWPLIPIQGGHPFRRKMATCSDPLWPVIPMQSGHP
jgi:hypothetical protein